MTLADLVDTHVAVASRSGRLEKIERLGALLSRAREEEVPVACAYLTGVLPQGRIGLGPATIRNARPTVAAESSAPSGRTPTPPG